MADRPPDRSGLLGVSTLDGVTTTYHNGSAVARYKQVAPYRPRKPRRGDPGKFVGPKLKVERAKKHIAELEAAIEAFHSTYPYRVTQNEDPQTGEFVVRVQVEKVVPDALSAVIGDAVHNLRCALDYVVCDLVRAHSDHDGQFRNFPVEKRPKRLKAGSIGKIAGVSAMAERTIIRLTNCNAWHSRMWALHWLDIFDKHNCIVAIAAATTKATAKVGVPGIFVGPDGALRLLSPGPDSIPLLMDAGTPEQFRITSLSEDNVEIYRASGGFEEEIQITFGIAFGKTEIVEGQSIPETLREFAEIVERTIEIMERHAL